MSQLRKTNGDARRSVKKRIELSKDSQDANSENATTPKNDQDEAFDLFDLKVEENTENDEKPMPIRGFSGVSTGRVREFP